MKKKKNLLLKKTCKDATGGRIVDALLPLRYATEFRINFIAVADRRRQRRVLRRVVRRRRIAAVGAARRRAVAHETAPFALARRRRRRRPRRFVFFARSRRHLRSIHSSFITIFFVI